MTSSAVISADTPREIAQARDILAQHGDRLRADPELTAALAGLKREAEATWAMFRELEVVALCSVCAQDTPGGCCFTGAGQWLTAPQLVINLLLGVELPDQPFFTHPPGLCWFVGPRGCTLIMRDAFCINYFCPDQKAALAHDMPALMRQAGREIDAGLRAEKALAGVLAALSFSSPPASGGEDRGEGGLQ